MMHIDIVVWKLDQLRHPKKDISHHSHLIQHVRQLHQRLLSKKHYTLLISLTRVASGEIMGPSVVLAPKSLTPDKVSNGMQ